MTQQQQPPKGFLCPLTKELMKDPVVCTDGHSYERAAIALWLEKQGHSPVTSEPMSASNIVPNIALRNSIQEWMQQQQGNNSNTLLVAGDDSNEKKQQMKEKKAKQSNAAEAFVAPTYKPPVSETHDPAEYYKNKYDDPKCPNPWNFPEKSTYDDPKCPKPYVIQPVDTYDDPKCPRPWNITDTNSGGCFDGQSLLRMFDGTWKPMSQLLPGDCVATSSNSSATVTCVVKYKMMLPVTQLVELNGMRITPYHPIRLQDGAQWVFPCDIKAPVAVFGCDYVYNLVLQSGHTIVVNGIECVTLGHGFESDSIVQHAYFGTQRVIDDLKAMPGWSQGYVTLEQFDMHRDSNTMLVASMSLRTSTVAQ